MFVNRSMERSGVKCFYCTHVFDLTNLKGEKRRNVGKLNNELVDKITKGVRLIPKVHYIVIGYQVPDSSCTLRITGSLKLEILNPFN
jgi:hypothetical protein